MVFNHLDPPEGFMNIKSIEEAKRETSPYLFDMEYNCFFPSDSDGFFKRSVLDKSREHNQFTCHLSSLSSKYRYVAGIDPARSGDNFAVAIVRIDIEAKTAELVRVLTYNKKSFPLMHREIRSILKLYNIIEFGMDSGGGGTTIRDLLADKEHCPFGEDLILQRGFDEHAMLQGRKILELIEFSKYEWVHDANHNLLSGLQHGILKIASPVGLVPNVQSTPAHEDADEEIDKTLDEMQNIVVSVTSTGRMRWDTPMKTQRKDRYSAVLIAYYMAHSYLESLGKPVELASGFWR
jgi:hypothetical protein